jgi:DnaJ-class molecular chaperone
MEVTCPKCGGSKVYTCPDCGGKGIVRGDWACGRKGCVGGKIPCPYCKGKGVKGHGKSKEGD